MSRRKCFFNCEKKLPLFGLPKDDGTRRLWIQFAFPDLPPQHNTNINLCALHFTDESFVNRAQYNAGFSARLLLKEGAVPTLLGHSGPSVVSVFTGMFFPLLGQPNSASCDGSC